MLRIVTSCSGRPTGASDAPVRFWVTRCSGQRKVIWCSGHAPVSRCSKNTLTRHLCTRHLCTRHLCVSHEQQHASFAPVRRVSPPAANPSAATVVRGRLARVVARCHPPDRAERRRARPSATEAATATCARDGDTARRERPEKVVQRRRDGHLQARAYVGEKVALVGSGCDLADPMPVGASCVNAPPRASPRV